MGIWDRSRGVVAVVVMVAAALTAVVSSPPPASADPPDLPTPDAFGIDTVDDELVEVAGFGGRMVDARIRTASIFQSPEVANPVETVNVRIYLPAGYDPNGAPYRTLYLLHGGQNNWSSWSNPSQGNAAAIVDSLVNGSRLFDGIVVMPEGGRGGWYIDWLFPSRGDDDGVDDGYQPLWQTFHMEQLVPWIDANFNTQDQRSGRTIAGLSMGGHGALKYAMHHQSLFSAVGSFSGGTNIRDGVPQQVVIANSVTVTDGAAISSVQGDALEPYLASDVQRVFGQYNSGRWEEHNPYDHPADYNSYDTKLGLYVARNGTDGLFLTAMNDQFHTRLNQAGVVHRYCTGNGATSNTHDWPYWREDLKDFLAYVFHATPASCPNGWGQPTG